MGSYRNTSDQSRFIVAQLAEHGRAQSDRNEGEAPFISSLGTERTYRDRIKIFLDWLKAEKIFKEDVTPALATRFLQDHRFVYQQSTLNVYRNALITCFDFDLPIIKSTLTTILAPRAYTAEQIYQLAKNARENLSLSIRLTAAAGLRAHELLAIGRATDFSKDSRDWLPCLFSGRENEIEYHVKGKGGLKRPVRFEEILADALESTRRSTSMKIRSRTIYYDSYFSLLGGQAFSQQFSRLSMRLFGWSTGAHGLRHHFAQRRLTQLQKLGYSFYEALKVVSQEMGHFSIANTLKYMR